MLEDGIVRPADHGDPGLQLLQAAAACLKQAEECPSAFLVMTSVRGQSNAHRLFQGCVTRF